MANKWTSVSKLSVVLETGEQRRETGSAYPDERIGAVITVQPTDDDGNPVEVTAQKLCESISLIDYIDESDIPLKDSNSSKVLDWCYEKTNDITWREGRTPQIKYYVAHSGAPKPRCKSIGLLVRTESGALVFSSLNGTYHSSVQIVASSPK
ncbi:hypothetical protein [Kitasatospora purpeofusca]|uniref:Uncharacterized protein n=1 Tax=Kitasatospora purpeofusca TaxID=67352 RepID=A0ABZ1UBE4_9ACTN|nr:hypothetical protein [Kitasatospora purpeofusca]